MISDCLIQIITIAPVEGAIDQRGDNYYLGNGFELVLVGINDNSTLLELDKNFLPVTTKSVEEGSKFNFTTRINGTKYVILEGTVEKVFDSKDPVVTLSNVNQYSDTPLEINVEDQYGKFEVTSVTSKTIELKNRMPIWINPGDYVTILDSLINFRVADNVYRACPYNMTKNVISSYQIRGASLTINRSDSTPEYNTSSDIEVTEEIHIGSFEKTTGRSLSATFYPFMNKVENVDSILPTTNPWSIPVMSIEEYLIEN